MAKPITDVLRNLRGGELIDEATKSICDVVNAVEATGKQGSVTIKITIKPTGSKAGALEILDDVKCVIPKDPKGSTLMYATPEGSLITQDPRQQNMNLQSVSIPNAETAIPTSLTGTK